MCVIVICFAHVLICKTGELVLVGVLSGCIMFFMSTRVIPTHVVGPCCSTCNTWCDVCISSRVVVVCNVVVIVVVVVVASTCVESLPERDCLLVSCHAEVRPHSHVHSLNNKNLKSEII